MILMRWGKTKDKGRQIWCKWVVKGELTKKCDVLKILGKIVTINVQNSSYSSLRLQYNP